MSIAPVTMLSCDPMSALKAHVVHGRIVVDEPVNLPEGMELEIYVFDRSGDDLDDEERAALHTAIDEGIADAEAGRVVAADVVLAALRTQSTTS